MKTFRLVGMAVAAFLMCVNFTSCKDDEPEGGNDGGVKGKKLIKVENAYAEGDINTYKYDSEGKLIAVNHDSGENSYTNTFSYNDYFIRESDETGEINLYTCDFENNNRVKSIKDLESESSITFRYDGSMLKSMKSEYKDVSFEWTNSNITTINESDNGSTKITYYEDKENKNLSINLYPSLYFGLEDFLSESHPSLFGMSTKNLVKEISYKGDDTYYYSYEFDKDGYVIKMIETNNLDNDYKEVITFTWE